MTYLKEKPLVDNNQNQRPNYLISMLVKLAPF